MNKHYSRVNSQNLKYKETYLDYAGLKFVELK